MVQAMRRNSHDKVMLQFLQGILIELDLPMTNDVVEGRQMVLEKLEREGSNAQIEEICERVASKIAGLSCFSSSANSRS